MDKNIQEVIDITNSNPLYTLGAIHNGGLMIQAENMINGFIEKDYPIWITDEEGNSFVPKGKIRVNGIVEMIERKKDE